MKRLLIAIVVLCCSFYAIAAGPNSSLFSGLKSPAVEIAELETNIAKAKATGQTPDPAWTARIRELIPMVKGHASKVPVGLPEMQINGGFAPGAVIRPTELTPLEEQIQQIEFELNGGLSFQGVDPVTFANLKEQLNDLYAQRPENRERNSLDQGNDLCPGTVVPDVPYWDTGTTIGYGNDYDPISPCASSASNDVVYEFTPAWTQTFHISLNGSLYDTYLYVNTGGPCPGNTQVACNDDYFGTQSYVEAVLNAGQTYYIIVDGFSVSREGQYTLFIDDNCEVSTNSCGVYECIEFPGPGSEVIDCNGSCQNLDFGGSESWQEISPFQTICGVGFTYTSGAGNPFRDVDSYRFTITERCSLALTINAEFASQMILIQGSCPYVYASNFFTWTYACSTVTFLTDCFEPGTYALVVLPASNVGLFNTGYYRVNIGLIPCSGCRIDEFLQAPGTGAGNTCGAEDNNNFRTSEDYTYCVNIPYESDWTFSTCNDDSIWDSYIYLSTQCNGGVIAEDDDACGGVGLSKINCVSLAAGTYYLTIESFSAFCGPFVLTVGECSGRCCYGDIYENPSCLVTGRSGCSELAGVFIEGLTCDTPCPVRPLCNDNSTHSQQPFMPTEPGTAYPSHVDLSEVQFDNYTAPNGVSSVRFWGFPLTCNGAPETFRVVFGNGPDSCIYNVTTTGTQLPEVYFGQFLLSQYDVQIDPPCGIPGGNFSVAKVGDVECQWFWATSPFGDAIHPTTLEELAFCLASPCRSVDSLTIFRQAPDDYVLRWWQPQDGTALLYVATDPNAIWPGGFALLGTLYGTAGSQNGSFISAAPFSYVVIVMDCGPAPTATDLNVPRLFHRADEKK